MSARDFIPTMERVGASAFRTYRLTCGSCGVTANIGSQSFGERLACDLVPKKFGERGWVVGKRPTDDRCPSCVAKSEQRKRAMSKLRVIDDKKPTAEPPREMSRDERRLIFAKLDEVYLDERRGYDNGWSDKRVADDLGVPRAWVAKIRDENFGSENSNDETRQLLEEARSVVAAARLEMEALNKKHEATIEALLSRVDRIAKQF